MKSPKWGILIASILPFPPQFKTLGKQLIRFIGRFLIPLACMGLILYAQPYLKGVLPVEYPLLALMLLMGITVLAVGPVPGLVLTAGSVFISLILLTNRFQLPLTAFPLSQVPAIAAFGGLLSLLSWLLTKQYRQSIIRERYLRSLIQHSIHPTLLKDRSGKVLFASDSIASFLGYHPKELQGKELTFLVHPKDRQKYRRFNEVVSKKPGHQETVELRMKKKDGSVVWMRNDAANRLYDPDIKAVVGSLQDISQQRYLDLQRLKGIQREKKARGLAEAAVKSRDEFLSIASHELKTPLTTVVLQLQTTLRHILTQSLADFSGEKLVKSLTIAEEQSQRLSSLIKDLLNVSLISTGRIELKREPVDMENLIKATIDRFQDQIQASGCKVRLSTNGPVQGNWDALRLEQAFINLLTNALKYGKGKPILITITKQGGYGEVAVQDKGPGVAKKDQKNIFEPFKRATKNHNIQGLGVGLFIAKRIAQAHKGHLKVVSKPGKGSTFLLQVPIS
jgi:PAS domain S-box-containing protein